ncbi:MAG: carboxylating nicotinate-nucleotide diphosphorylase [Proteobacteria bacterium]|nr:carboxylating nicotinate-nucleotide diphosphorylase [Pseudomonadota bacterium]MDA0992944.1 carboxylating nicotinate-nucleotide diphosphorylase [Pseudomonadota bacterium]
MTNSDNLTAAISINVRNALEEDLGTGDLTASLVAADANARAIVITREPMTMAGQPWVNEVFRQLSPDVNVEWFCNDGDHVPADAELCIITGPARSILSGERTALNFLQLLSATATTTAHYVQEIKGTMARILDTRKTVPGLRLAQKYAVRCGGGDNHRIGLFDALLIKENHIVSNGGIASAVAAAKHDLHGVPVEIEVESLAELREAIAAGADRVLLDNFDIEDLQHAVDINQKDGNPPAGLESSGGITMKNIRAIAETGVDYISVGALTKDIKAIDLSMRFYYED